MPSHRHAVPQPVTAMMLTLAMFISVIGFTIATASTATATNSDQALFFNATNASRALNGLGPLAFDEAASGVAQRWASQMAAQNNLHHNPNLRSEVEAFVTTKWTRLGENVGVGPNIDALQPAFMNSSGHRANILGNFNRIGVGAVRQNGNLWVVAVFLQAPPSPLSIPSRLFPRIGICVTRCPQAVPCPA